VKIGAQDILLKSPVSDISFALYDSDNNLIRSWSSSGTDEEFQALPAGTYTVKVNGEKGKRQTFVVRDEAQEQIFRFSVWTSQSMLIAAGGCLALPILLLILRGILKFWKRKKEEHKGGGEA
jgi:flagellar hook assembly protein FlgD